jgi:hypothetical protein
LQAGGGLLLGYALKPTALNFSLKIVAHPQFPPIFAPPISSFDIHLPVEQEFGRPSKQA